MAAAARRFVVALVVLASCSGGGSSTGTTASAASTTNDAARETVPLVDEIYVAVKALETKLGAPQQFFEINATSSLVNLIVALNDGAVAQPWVYATEQTASARPAHHLIVDLRTQRL